MLTLEQARDILRIDGTENDAIIQSLMDTVPDYIELSTGVSKTEQVNEPLVDTVEGFLLKLWFDNLSEQEANAMQRIIDNFLKTITLKRVKPIA